MGLPFLIGGFGDAHHPDVGGILSGTPGGWYCIVWQDDASGSSIIWASMVDVNGNNAGCLANVSAFAPNQTAQQPSISKTAGAPPGQAWTVVWREQPTPTSWWIPGRQVNVTPIACASTGLLWPSFLGLPFLVDGASLALSNPQVSPLVALPSSPSPQYLVVYELNNGFNLDVYGRVMSGSTVLTAATNLSALEGVSTAAIRNQFSPVVDTDGCRFAVAYAESVPMSLTNYDVFAASFQFAGGSLSLVEGHQILGGPTSIPDIRPEIVSSQDSLIHRHLIVWDEASPTTAHNVRAAFYDSHSSVGGVTTLATGCGPHTLGSAGIPGLGQNIVLMVSPPTPSLLAWGLPQTPPTLLCGTSCSLGVVPFLFLPGTGWAFTIPCDPALVGASFAQQAFKIGSPGGCTSPFSFTMTETILLTIG